MKQDVKRTLNIKKIFSNPTLYGTSIISIGMLMSSTFNYFTQFFLGRSLSTSDFGTFNALLSLSVLMLVPTSILNTSLIKTAADIGATNSFKKLTYLFWRLILISGSLGLIAFTLIFLFLPHVANNLQIDDPKILLLFGGFVGISFIKVVPGAFLQGLLRYKGHAFNVAFGGFLRLALIALFVGLGFHLFGAITGLLLSTLFSVIVSFYVLKKNLTDVKNPDVQQYYKKILGFSIPVLFIQLGLASLVNIDVILVKKFFESDVAGYYAGTVMLGKIMLFGTNIIASSMFPQIAALHSKKQNHRRRFQYFFWTNVAIVLVGILIYTLFPKLLVLMFFGKKFLFAVDYLPKFSIFIALYILSSLIIKYYLAVENTLITYFLIATTAAQFLLIYFFHNSLDQVININIMVGFILFLTLFVYTFFVTPKVQKSLETVENV